MVIAAAVVLGVPRQSLAPPRRAVKEAPRFARRPPGDETRQSGAEDERGTAGETLCEVTPTSSSVADRLRGGAREQITDHGRLRLAGARHDASPR